jgi:hypothetical protein
MNGWVKLHKQIIENDFLQNDMSAYVLFTKLLLVVNTKTGVYTTGRFKLSQLSGLKPTTAYNTLLRLEKSGMVTQESNNRFTTVSICNWKKYQGRDDSSDDNQMTTSRQPDDTNKDIRTKIEEVLVPNTTKVVYGKKHINDLFEFWQDNVGYEITSRRQANRNACSSLYKKYGQEGVEKLIMGVVKTESDKYAPRISDFAELQAKLNQLLAWGKKQSTNTMEVI